MYSIKSTCVPTFIIIECSHYSSHIYSYPTQTAMHSIVIYTLVAVHDALFIIKNVVQYNDIRIQLWTIS